MLDKIKEFKPSSWAIDNRTSIYVITIILSIMGIYAYNKMPKERFPEIVIPTIYVNTIYPGTSPGDIENLITKPIEKQIKAISGVKKLTSTSVQDYSIVVVEFDTDVDVPTAKQKVKDAVDKSRSDLPTDLTREPNVIEVDFSELPMLYINISGDFDLNKLKKFADRIEDEVEALKEITRVDIVGALDREIQINVDMYKLQAATLTMTDLNNAIAYENVTVSGGQVKMDGMTRAISVSGEIKDVKEIENIVVRSMTGAQVYLKDIAEIKDGFKDQESYARLAHKKVITLNVIKRSGENLIEASDKIHAIMEKLQKEEFPKDLKVTMTGDQSGQTRLVLHELINTIIIGFILVTVVLMFFMGVTNAVFVALSVPLSMFLAFLVMPSIGFTMNMMVLFSLLLALGIVVDDAIVVIENTHRIFNNGKVPIVQAAKMATGEVFLPVLSGTLTTLAPFIPLAFWSGIVGKFMFFLPITLIITLLASLLVAYIINPVFASDFMKPHDAEHEKKKGYKGIIIISLVSLFIALLFHGGGSHGIGNFIIFIVFLMWLYRLILDRVIKGFQTKAWPGVQNVYEKIVTWSLKGARPALLLAGTIGLLFFSFFVTYITSPPVVFFPKADPNFVYVYLNLPIGTDVAYTDSITHIVEDRVYEVVGESNPLVESVISNVAIGATDPTDGDRTTAPNKGKVSVSFVQFALRNGQSTAVYLDKIREAVKGIPGAEITVDQERNGPPVGKPISIEIYGDDFMELATTSNNLKKYLEEQQIRGVEELKSDLQNNKPELVIDIDRERANREGIFTGQIGSEVRTAVFGKEVSKFRDDNDDYPIMLRMLESQRNDIDALMNMKVTYRDMTTFGIRQIPLSSVAKVHYQNTYGGIKRKNQKRLITLSSNVLNGYNPNEVVANVTAAIEKFPKPEAVTVKMAGEQEDQKESQDFLQLAMLISVGLIFVTLVTQFNSISKTVLILSEVMLSLIGVLLGFSLFHMEISIVMTGVGIVALAGIVVRNGILLVEFTDLLREQGVPLKAAIIEAGKTRMTPVILTATATMLGLVPLAVGFNIDFESLFTHLDPRIYFGGDNVAFWGPLSWTMIFGLGFATFLTLILVPVMYLIADNMKVRAVRVLDHVGLPRFFKYVPFLVLICMIFVKRDVYRITEDGQPMPSGKEGLALDAEL